MGLTLAAIAQFGAAVETVELTAETIAASGFATPCTDVEIRPETEVVRRSPVGLSESSLQPAYKRRTAAGKVSFEVAPSGTATAPLLWSILQCTGATLSGLILKWGDDVSNAAPRGKSVTFQHEDGTYIRKSIGSRATAKFRLNDKGYLVVDLAFAGRYSKTSGSFTGSVATSSLVPCSGPGSVLTLGGSTVMLNDFEYNIEGSLQTLEDSSNTDLAGATVIQGLKQTAKFTVFENGTPDWETKVKNLTTGDKLSVSHVFGSVANNIVTFAGTLGIDSVARIEVQGVVAYTISGEFLRNGTTGAFTCTQS